MTNSVEQVDTGDASLRCELYGDGPVVVCAHGFPDCERSFREQVPALVRAGYRVVVPTMRGYAPSTVARSGRYDPGALAEDLLALADHYAPGRPVRLFGHDWGAMAAYAAAALRPERVSHLATAAVPHLRVAAAGFLRPAQLRRSWYIGFFQLPRLPERRLRRDGMALVGRLWRAWSPGFACPEAEMRRIREALDPQLEAVLGYYRAFATAPLAPRRLLLAKTRVPSLYLHGADDGCVGAELARGTERAYTAGVSVHVIPRAGHFVHLEQPEAVNRLLVDFFAS
jgi:pimeloyl-ACP methyl ester carboxylesterase